MCRHLQLAWLIRLVQVIKRSSLLHWFVMVMPLVAILSPVLVAHSAGTPGSRHRVEALVLLEGIRSRRLHVSAVFVSTESLTILTAKDVPAEATAIISVFLLVLELRPLAARLLLDLVDETTERLSEVEKDFALQVGYFIAFESYEHLKCGQSRLLYRYVFFLMNMWLSFRIVIAP